MEEKNNGAGRKSLRQASWKVQSDQSPPPCSSFRASTVSILVIGKNVAVLACQSPQRFLLRGGSVGMERPVGEGVRERGGKGGGEEAEREGEREYHSFIVVCFPTINDSGRGAEQLNIQTAQ